MTWVPPYFGSYEQLLQALLHNPFLGSGGPHPPHPPLTHAPKMETESLRTDLFSGPCRAAAASVIQQLSLIELTAALPKDQAAAVKRGLEQSLEDDIDDICGNRPRLWPRWPWPGPPPWALQIASEVTVFANTLQEGALKSSALSTAAVITQKAFAGTNAGITVTRSATAA